MRWRRRTEIFSPCQREEGLSLFVTHAPHWLLSTYSHPSHPLAPEVYQLPIGRGRSYVGIESLCPYYCVLVILHHSLCTYIVSLTLFFLIHSLSYRVSSVSSSFSSLSCPLSLFGEYISTLCAFIAPTSGCVIYFALICLSLA
jgi:hypothetical protein